ncbi:MAG: hypothetical protein ACR2NN_12360 [Bryobacteraceae bacterium]
MAEKKKNGSEGVLVEAAKAIGAAAGKVASLAGATVAEKPAPAQLKEGAYAAQYLGSGTFIISKPKRKDAKRRQSRLKGTVRGARK